MTHVSNSMPLTNISTHVTQQLLLPCVTWHDQALCNTTLQQVQTTCICKLENKCCLIQIGVYMPQDHTTFSMRLAVRLLRGTRPPLPPSSSMHCEHTVQPTGLCHHRRGQIHHRHHQTLDGNHLEHQPAKQTCKRHARLDVG